MTVSTIRPPWWPASRGCYSRTWKALAKAMPATYVVSVVLLVVAGLATLPIRSRAGQPVRDIGNAVALDAHTLAASDARDLERMDSDRG